MKIIVIDNYDSFTYNLVQYIQEIIGGKIDVFRNDAIAISEIEKYDKIILSPGPGLPSETTNLKEIIKKYAPTKSILGVCLGHEAIAEVFGGSLKILEKVYHGIATDILLTDKKDSLFNELSNNFQAGRYHSWVVNTSDFPRDLEITAVDSQGEIMALAHKKYDVKGVQFHPESVLTPEGKTILRNFLKS